MTIQTIVIPSIAPGKTSTVTLDSGQYTARVLVNDIEVLSKIRGKPWTIAEDLDDLALIADACRGAYKMAREGGQ
jgi:hypothetical protein